MFYLTAIETPLIFLQKLQRGLRQLNENGLKEVPNKYPDKILDKSYQVKKFFSQGLTELLKKIMKIDLHSLEC